MLWTIPDNCGRCKKKTKVGTWVGLPTNPPKKTKGGMTYGYTPMIYICDKCIKSLMNWLTLEK